MSELQVINQFSAGLLKMLSPAQLQVLNRRIGQSIYKSTTQRISAQLDADGIPFAPRKNQSIKAKASRRAIRKGKMFKKIRNRHWLRVHTTPTFARLFFWAAGARIAKMHQFGGSEIDKRGVKMTYPARELLGFSAADLAVIDYLVMRYFADVQDGKTRLF